MSKRFVCPKEIQEMWDGGAAPEETKMKARKLMIDWGHKVRPTMSIGDIMVMPNYHTGAYEDYRIEGPMRNN
jgi:hypothetical protein